MRPTYGEGQKHLPLLNAIMCCDKELLVGEYSLVENYGETKIGCMRATCFCCDKCCEPTNEWNIMQEAYGSKEHKKCKYFSISQPECGEREFYEGTMLIKGLISKCGIFPNANDEWIPQMDRGTFKKCQARIL
jgi:hypothetical protein